MDRLRECTDCGRLVPDPHAPHDCDGAEYLDAEAFAPARLAAGHGFKHHDEP